MLYRDNQCPQLCCIAVRCAQYPKFSKSTLIDPHILFSVLLSLQQNEHNNPDSIPPSDRRWLLVAWSADFADVGPMLACQPTLRLDVYILPTLGQRRIFIQDGGEQ